MNDWYLGLPVWMRRLLCRWFGHVRLYTRHDGSVYCRCCWNWIVEPQHVIPPSDPWEGSDDEPGDWLGDGA